MIPQGRVVHRGATARRSAAPAAPPRQEASGRVTAMLTLAVELGVPPNGSTRMTLLATRVPSAAFTIDQVSAARSRRAKLRLVLRAVVPPPHIMRYWFPRAPPGRLGLVVAYLSRPVSIATRLIPAVRAWRRAANARKVA